MTQLLVQYLSTMTILLKEKIKQLSSYLSAVLLDGVDVSALYIIQAQLTTIRASVKPSTLLMNSFSSFQIKKILTYSKEYFERLKYRSNADYLLQPQSLNDNLNMFNVSLKDIEEKPLKQISLVSGRIMDTLNEWESLSSKTGILRGKLGTLTQYNLCLSSDDSLKEELQSLICLIDISTIDKQFKNIAQSTQCFSLPEDSEVTQTTRQLKVSDIAYYLKSILAWSNDILDEITDFSRLIEVIRADTSMDVESEFDHRMSRHLKGQTLIKISTEGSSGRQRMSNITQQLSRGKENELKMRQPLPTRKKYSHNTVEDKDSVRPLRPMNIISDIDWNNNKSGGKQIRQETEAQAGEKTCHKCEIY